MMLCNSSTWLLVVVFVNVVSAANIDETEDSVKTSFISLLKNIVNINEKRIDAMKHVDEEKDFRLGSYSYLSTIHKLNDNSQEYETNQNPYLSIIDKRRNLNLAFRESYAQPRALIEDEAKMFLPFERFNFNTLKIENKKTVLQSNDYIIELPSGYQSEPSILDIINKRSKDDSEKINSRIFQKDNDIIKLPTTYPGKSSVDNIIAPLFTSDDNHEKKKKPIFHMNDDTIKLTREYLKNPSIQDLIIKNKLNESYKKKRNEVRQKKDIIRKLQDILNIFIKTYMVKDHNENIIRNIVNHNSDDETAEDAKFEDRSKKKPDNVDLVFTFDDGEEGEESQWTDWSYEFEEGEAFSSWENKDARKIQESSRADAVRALPNHAAMGAPLRTKKFVPHINALENLKKLSKRNVIQHVNLNSYPRSKVKSERKLVGKWLE